MVLAATREAEGVAEEERHVSLRPNASLQAAVPLSPSSSPPSSSSPSLPPSSQLVDFNTAASSIDRIELQAKSSIDKLKHLLYKLKTRPPVAETTVVRAAPEDGGNIASSAAVVTDDQREVYISQKIEVDLSSPQDVIDSGTIDPSKTEVILPPDLPSEEAVDSGSGRTVKRTETTTQLDSVTCTRTTVQFDEENHTAVVTVTATVRGTDIIADSAYTERTIAMAAKALARTCLALDEKAQLAALMAGPMADIILSRGQQQQHDSILKHLAHGEVVSFKKLKGGIAASPFRQVYSVVLRSKEGKEMEAVFKPVVAGDRHGRWQRAPVDWLAYQMAILLGTDVVPPATIRSNIQLGKSHFPSGAMVFNVKNVRPLVEAAAEQWGEQSAAAVVSNAHILDAILGAAPRRQSGFQLGQHWATHGELRPVLLDFPMGPGLGDIHSAWSKRGQISGVKHVTPITLSRLRGLNRRILLENMGSALTADEMDMILEKRDQVVAYFDAMAMRHGRHLVVV